MTEEPEKFTPTMKFALFFALFIFFGGFFLFAYEDNREFKFQLEANKLAQANCAPVITAEKPCFDIINEGQRLHLCTHRGPEAKP